MSFSKENEPIERLLRPGGRAMPVVLIIWGLWILWGFGCETVLDRLLLQVDGTVISEQNVPAKGAPRYTAYYALRSPDGGLTTYAAGATDASLERGLPIGTRIQKQRWRLGYNINDRWIAFPTIFYFITLSVGSGAIIVGSVQWRRLRRGGSATDPEKPAWRDRLRD